MRIQTVVIWLQTDYLNHYTNLSCLFKFRFSIYLNLPNLVTHAKFSYIYIYIYLNLKSFRYTNTNKLANSCQFCNYLAI